MITDDEVKQSKGYISLRKISTATDEKLISLVRASLERELLEEKQKNCKHEKKTFSHTYDDWYDGDSDDIYYCDDCNKRITVYIRR